MREADSVSAWHHAGLLWYSKEVPEPASVPVSNMALGYVAVPRELANTHV